MTHTEQSSLSDIYQLLSNEDRVEQTSYILHFLWRDLTGTLFFLSVIIIYIYITLLSLYMGDFDIIGPYFTCLKTLGTQVYICGIAGVNRPSGTKTQK